MSQMTTERPPEVPPEIPLPPPATPEREPERSPAHERLSVAVGEASVWVAELRRRAREFARRHDVTPRVSFVLAGGERVVVAAVAAGPGTAFVTVTPAQPSPELTELIVRLDDVARVELAATRADAADRFRGCGRDLGFSMSQLSRRVEFANTIEEAISPEAEDFLQDYVALGRWGWHACALDDGELERLSAVAAADWGRAMRSRASLLRRA